MTPERWRKVEDVYDSAMEREPGLRGAFLAQACGSDRELQREVESLLELNDSPVLVDQPAWEAVPELLEDNSDLAPGAQLGPYRIEEAIGAGAMGQVYRARDTRLGRSVAVKICRFEFGNRFEREARSVAALNHPNICTLHDVGPNYLVMELVEGPTLAERIGQGQVPLEEALRIARQISDALEAAHERGIVHRDLKPGNIKIKPGGAVKVLDFGLAKLAIATDAPTGKASDSPPAAVAGTEAGMILGTVAYMSPEQARGEVVDKRADIWAFGVVLLEMLTGRRLFEGHTMSDTLAAVLRQEPEWDGVPKTAHRLLRSCLEKDPRRRLRDIGDAWKLLDDAPENPPGRSARWIPWAALASLLAGLAAWAFLRTPPAEPRPVSRWTITLPSPPPRSGLGIALSRDGTRLAYAEQVGGTSRLVVRSLNEREGRPIEGTEGGLRPFFSPDGRWLAYFSGATGPIKKVPVTGGSSTVLCDSLAHYTGGHWNDDDSIIFSGGDRRFFRVAARGGPCEKLNTPQGSWPQVLPGSRSMLFTSGFIGGFDAAKVAVLDLKSGAQSILVNGGTQARYVPSGHLVYARSGTLFAVPFDLKRLAVTGPEAAVIEDVLYFSGGGYAEYAFSDLGLLVYMDRQGVRDLGTLEWLDRKGASQSALVPPRDYGLLRLSPDGRRVAIAASGAVGGNPSMWVVDLARGTQHRLTSDEWIATSPLWTPDGERVLFSAITGKRGRGIYSAPADGSGEPELLVPSDGIALPLAWTPDGKILLYHMEPSGIWSLAVQAKGPEGEPRMLFEATFRRGQARISPDGHWIAYTSDETGTNQIYIRSFSQSERTAGTKTVVSIEGGQEPRWSPDGREIYFRNPATNQLMAVDIQIGSTIRAGRPKALFELRSQFWDIAPDGRFLVVRQPDTATRPARMQVVVNWFEELRQKAPVGRRN